MGLAASTMCVRALSTYTQLKPRNCTAAHYLAPGLSRPRRPPPPQPQGIHAVDKPWNCTPNHIVAR